jgi:hypothetical protein
VIGTQEDPGVKQLTQQEKDFFDTFGFLKFPQLMAHEIDSIIDEFEAVWKVKGGGHNGKLHEGKARSCIVPFIDQSAKLSALLDDPNIEGVAAGLLGDDFNYIGSDGNYYAGDTSWHSDGWHGDGPRFIKIAFYLDPLTRDTGALRVIPGSHKPGDKFADELTANLKKGFFSVKGCDIPAVALDINPGDVVVFNHNIKHASFGGSGWRRMFTINLCQRHPENRVHELTSYIEVHARFWLDHLHGPVMVETATPGRMRHLEQVIKNEGRLAELSREHRQKMLEPSRG